MIVIETSAIVNALVGYPADPKLLAVLSDDELHAPALLDFEVASALRGHLLGGKLDRGRIDEAIDDFSELRIERHEMTGAIGHLIDLRENFTACDAAYVVLAQILGGPLVTADAKLGEARRLGVDVRTFGMTA